MRLLVVLFNGKLQEKVATDRTNGVTFEKFRQSNFSNRFSSRSQRSKNRCWSNRLSADDSTLMPLAELFPVADNATRHSTC